MSNETPNTPSRKPVVLYIMILCIAAFLLMALSFAMNQRSNREALGDLETSFNATIAEIQETQEKIVALEKELDAANDEIIAIQQQAADTSAALQTAETEAAAMEALYVLQQKYSNGMYEDCLSLIAHMENTGLVKALSPIPIASEFGGSVTAPYNRFLQFKEAVHTKLESPIGSSFWS